MYILQNKFHLDFIIPKDPLSSKILLLQNSKKSQYCAWSLKNQVCLYEFYVSLRIGNEWKIIKNINQLKFYDQHYFKKNWDLVYVAGDRKFVKPHGE